ncbi:hypothetical protein ACFQX7_04115 [Luedemannella flava]
MLITHNGDPTDQQRLWVASLAAGGGEPAPIAGLTALVAHGLRTFEAPAIWVLLPRTRDHRNPPAGVIVHQTTTLTSRDLHPTGRPPRIRAPRSLVEAAAWARTNREARAIIAATYQQQLVRHDDVLDALARAPNVNRHRLIATTVRDAATARPPWASSTYSAPSVAPVSRNRSSNIVAVMQTAERATSTPTTPNTVSTWKSTALNITIRGRPGTTWPDRTPRGSVATGCCAFPPGSSATAPRSWSPSSATP